ADCSRTGARTLTGNRDVRAPTSKRKRQSVSHDFMEEAAPGRAVPLRARPAIPQVSRHRADTAGISPGKRRIRLPGDSRGPSATCDLVGDPWAERKNNSRFTR